MALSLTQSKILEQLGSKRSGLATKEANNARKLANDEMNLVDPPVNCPKWVCCLLPCIKNIPSMKIFKQILPEDAEIKRNNKWVCHDAASVVRGDIIRLREGDIVPADCIVLSLANHFYLLCIYCVLIRESLQYLLIRKTKYIHLN